MRTRIKNYLFISKKEWNGIVVLIILIALIFTAPYIYQVFHKDSTINYKDFDKAVALLNHGKEGQGKYPDNNHSFSDEKLPNPVMFAFNPNDLTTDKWQKLGLSEYQANVIKHYEAKGGKFYSKEDVQKIYSVTAEDYKRLAPYIELPTKDYISKKIKPGTIIEINSADSATLTTIRGIGPSFATRIIRYRERLGGFYRKEQLREVFGVDSLKYEELKNQISVNPAHVNKININKSSFDELRRFPYLTFKQANAVIEYHNQHGDYTSIADMKNIAIIDDKALHKIEPYLFFR